MKKEAWHVLGGKDVLLTQSAEQLVVQIMDRGFGKHDATARGAFKKHGQLVNLITNYVEYQMDKAQRKLPLTVAMMDPDDGHRRPPPLGKNALGCPCVGTNY